MIKKVKKEFKNITIVNILNNNINLYSAIKIKENNPPPNSVLNPLTNSDSPSEKSKGERLHSATHLINQIKISIKRTIQIPLLLGFISIMWCKEKFLNKNLIKIITKIKSTS